MARTDPEDIDRTLTHPWLNKYHIGLVLDRRQKVRAAVKSPAASKRMPV